MHAFYNHPDTLVEQMIEALLATAPLARLDTSAGRVLMRDDWSPQAGKVAVISGGGAGHEPAHAGFVGRGMLTAAVIGELFASPSVGAIEAAIAALCGPAGCLLIVKNYTGDRLNFGLAAERARARRGLAVEVVLVADDVALPGTPQPRGIAGTLLVHKIAGFHAERGESLAAVAQAARGAAARMRTIALALSAARLPGRPARQSEPALGLGIHNEAGARRIAPASASEAMALVLEALAVDGSDQRQRWIALLNDLGGCAPQERLILAAELLRQLGGERITRLIGPAPLMSALDMHGFSLTLLDSSPALIEALEAPVAAPAWPGVLTPHTARIQSAGAAAPVRPDPSGGRDASREALIRAVAERLLDSRDHLDRLDAHSGDGDAGSTFAAGAAALLQALDQGRLPSGEDAALWRAIAALLEARMGGSSGVLLSILFTAGAARLAAGESWLTALGSGVERVRQHGGAALNDRTLLDALVPALEALAAGQGLPAAALAARRGADATAAMRARAGRAAQVPEAAQRGHIDPGAEAIARVFETLAAASSSAEG